VATHSTSRSYNAELFRLQVELVKLQKHVIARDQKLLLLFEGRDAAGKDGAIKHIVEHLSPRETRVVALGKPNEREIGTWYFQRFVAHLPAVQEIVCFNRSWYNRAGVERVMGFCSAAEVEEFFDTVLVFERLLIRSGIRILKFYLDITREEQKKRLQERRRNPLKQWKLSPIDSSAQKHWKDYTKARDNMFSRSHDILSPWWIVRADNKHRTRLNIIRTILQNVDYAGKPKRLPLPDPRFVRRYGEEGFEKLLAR
jgi:polyphosphate kinase 2